MSAERLDDPELAPLTYEEFAAYTTMLHATSHSTYSSSSMSSSPYGSSTAAAPSPAHRAGSTTFNML
jgi:hypothetical protein